jgi:hypothetical protein
VTTILQTAKYWTLQTFEAGDISPTSSRNETLRERRSRGYCVILKSPVFKRSEYTLTRPIQLSPGTQMDDLQLQQLVQAIQSSKNRRDPVVHKQIDQLLKEVSSRFQPAKRY